MSQLSKTTAASENVAKPENVLVAGTRVDPAHVVREAPIAPLPGEAESADDRLLPTGLTSDAVQASQARLEAQAEQLADYLRQRQEELDRREGQMNARLAEFDQEVRSARLWLAEQRQELEEREKSLNERESAADDKLAQCAASDRLRQAERESLEDRELRLSLRQAELAAQEESLSHPPVGATGPEEADPDHRFEAGRQELIERQQRLEQAEMQLVAAHEELAQARRQLEERREQLEAQARADRRRLAEIQRKNEAELAQKKQSLSQCAERLDYRQTALERSRLELTRQQREAIEIRLAAEELQAELAGSMAPAAWERSLGALRQRLSECYRLEALLLGQQQSELEALKAELLAEHETLSRRQQELQTWATARHGELQQQAARLETREQELDRQQTSWTEQQQIWREERFALKQEIRRLSGAVRRQSDGRS